MFHREETRPQFCYQVQDFTMPLPKQLEDLHMTCNINHPREALALVVHVLMTETGFEIEGWQEDASDGSTEGHTAKENLCWVKSDSLLKLLYTHPTCPAARFSVAFLFVEPNVIIHGLVMVDDYSEGFSLNLRISDFIQKVFLSDPEPNKVYKNLTTMSRIVKDSVALPLLGWAQSVSNVPATFGFMTLSNEIQLLILGYLNVRDLLAASRVSVDLFSLSSHPVLWRKLFFKNYPSVEISPTENISDWRERYKREYLLRKEQRECALRLMPRMPDPMGLPLRINHRPFVPPPMPLLIDDEFEFDGLLPRPPRFSPPYLPEMPRRMPDPALPRPYFSRFGILPHQRFGPGFDFL
ncbi:unnamed protein product [Ixodes hexagonus]